MGVKSAQYASQIAQDLSRGPSMGMWYDCPIEDFKQDDGGGIPGAGMWFYDDFLGFPNFGLFNGERQIGQWNAWIGNNAGAAIATGADKTTLPQEGGVLGLTGGTTAIDISMTAGLGAFRFVTSATGNAMTGRKLWFETRIAVGTIATANLDLFVGLMDTGDAGTRITSAASLIFSATNTLNTATSMGACIGFWKRATTNPADVAAVYNVNNGVVQLPGTNSNLQQILTNSGVPALASGLTAMSSTAFVAAANVWQKLGLVYDPTPSCPSMLVTAAITTNQTVGQILPARVRYFLNGQLLPWFLTTNDVVSTKFPNTFLVPTIGYRSGGTAAGVGYVDWMRVAQFASF